MDGIDILIVGAGPAGLAAGIRARQVAVDAGRDVSVAVIDKAPAPGNHVLSGAAFEPAVLDDLLPGWRDIRHSFTDTMVPVEREDLMFLRANSANRIPPLVVPSRMHHTSDVVISASRLVQFLAEQAAKLGVEVYHGYTARTLIVEDGVVRGVRLAELGLRADGTPKGNHIPAEEIRAPVTILADGTHGVLAQQFAEHFGGGANPQVLSLGMKAIVQFPEASPFGNNRVMHTLGYPNPPSVFGGGFLYSLGEKTVAVGLILGLDWKYGDLNPQREFETFRAHPYITRLLKGGVTVATGAKTIPEGGYASIGALSAPGGMVIGDGAGFVNMEKIKGIHYAIRSGMAAAETAVGALGEDGVVGALDGYCERLEASGVLEDMRHAATTGRCSPRAGCSSARPSRSSRQRSRSSSASIGTGRRPGRAPASTARTRSAWTGRRSWPSPARSTARTSRPTSRSRTLRSASSARPPTPTRARTSAPARSTAGMATRSSCRPPTASTACRAR
jgi:electron-transferring-flavoprotein dehydrogenase